MDPFEKRDRIPRTPPGQSFIDWPDLSVETYDQNCSLYDESGVRRSSIHGDVKKYSVFFENASKPSFRPSFGYCSVNKNDSFMIEKHKLKCETKTDCEKSILSKSIIISTSSPVNKSTPVRPMKILMDQVTIKKTDENKLLSNDKENFIPSDITSTPNLVTVKKCPARQKRKLYDENSAEDNFTFSSHPPSTVRQLRPRLTQTNDTSHSSSVTVRHSNRKLKATQSSRGRKRLESKVNNSHASSVNEKLKSPHANINSITPPTIVPAAKVRKTNNENSKTQIKQAKRINESLVKTNTESIINSMSFTSNLDDLTEIRQILPCSKRKQILETTKFNENEPEPIASRLRRTTRVSYVEPKLNKSVFLKRTFSRCANN